MLRMGIRRAAALVALTGQMLLPLFAMTAAGGDAVCSARAWRPPFPAAGA